MPLANSIRAALCTASAVALALAVGSGSPRAQTTAPITYQVMIRSVTLGSEQIAIERFSDGWTVSSSGRVARPIDVILRNFNARYDNEWKARELTIDITLRGQAVQLHTVINGSSATTRTTAPGAAPAENTEQID